MTVTTCRGDMTRLRLRDAFFWACIFVVCAGVLGFAVKAWMERR